ncbi:MAG: hydroxymethylbilane synthase [Xanthomonadales bacterium]|nr:hydroxymethylbilane synthase [Xanthomonadales bacterium]
MRLVIATRRSPLALRQSELAAAALKALEPALEIAFLPLVTSGDRILDRALAELGGKGLFLKELEEALRDRRADLAVHSLKDVPAELAPGLCLGAVLPREDPRDALVSERFASLAALPAGARVGTSSPRRAALLRALRPELDVVPLRGNVGTRLGKLARGEYDALIMAAAGLLRLGEGARIREWLDPERFVPAVGQGVIAIECREEDGELRGLLAALDHAPTRIAARAERAFAAALGGHCQLPVAAYARWQGEDLVLRAMVVAADGRPLAAEARGAPAEPEALGRALAERLRAAERAGEGALALAPLVAPR